VSDDAPDSTIRDIADTARWVAFNRALESERPDALFHDRHARRLAGERGAAIARRMPRAATSAWSTIVRTCIFDEIVLRLVNRERAGAVVNLAAGLDTRPYRLALPATLRWVEVDLAPMVAYKEEALAGERPGCTVERVALDLADRAARRQLFARLAGLAERVLVVSEGLLIYLPEEEVTALAADLAAQPSFHWWLIDLRSARLLAYLQKGWNRRLEKAGAAFRFAPQAGADFFRPFGWQALENRSFWAEGERLGRRIPLGWFYRLLAWLIPRRREERLRMSSGVLLGRMQQDALGAPGASVCEFESTAIR